MMQASNLIDARGLRVRFGRRMVLRDLDLTVPCGSITALVGANGAGKSTLLRVLVGALVAGAGNVRVLGLDASRQGARVRDQVGYVPDRLDLPARARGCDWLRLVARFHGSWSAARESELVQSLELDPRQRIGELSKGGRTKLALIAALAFRPRLVMLDEPFSGLDADSRRALSTALLAHASETSHGILFASHSLADVERLADRLAVLEDGRISRAGPLEELARSPSGGLDLEALIRSAANMESVA